MDRYAARAEVELRDDILPFWIRHAVDHERGGFYGQITNDLHVIAGAARGALLSSRILWTFSAAYRRYADPAYLEMAHHAYVDLLAHFWDDTYGGLFWEGSADGRPTNTRKQIYGQAFGIYGLSEYHRATGDPEALERAIDLFRLIESHAREPVYGGYLEAFGRDWAPIDDVRLSVIDLNAPKSQNTHLHLLEAYTNLLRAWDNLELRRAQVALLDVLLERIIDPLTGHMTLFSDLDWRPMSDRISFGHDIEASWLIVEAAEVLGDPTLLEWVRIRGLELARVTLSEGFDADGALLYEAGPEGLSKTEKEWWPQAEAVVGLINAYQLGGDPTYLQAAYRTWDFIAHCLIDPVHGEWFRYVTRAGEVGWDEPKVSFWKCPYHNGRACMEMAERLRAIEAAAPDD